MDYMLKLACLLLTGSLLFAQSDGEQLVTVPQKYVSTEGIKHQESGPEIGKWAGIGKEIGIATKEGLGSAVEAADKFGATRVGNFVLFMVAWKIIGREVVRYVIGVPVWIAGIAVWLWVLRRFFLGYQALDRVEGRTKFYKRQEPYKFYSSEARAGAGALLSVGLVAWNIAMLVLILS